jgi:phage shock protein A
MNPFKRLFVSVRAQINEVADDFENHEAVAEAAIRDLEKAVARTRVQVSRLDRELKALDERRAALGQDAALWAERAVRVRGADETRALECVRRLEAAERDAARAAESHRETLALRQQIQAELDRQTARLEEAKRRKTLLSSRQYRAECVHVSEPGAGTIPLDDLFDRWEIRLSATELDAPDRPPADTLAFDFEREEKARALRDRLDRLSPSVQTPSEPKE